MKEELDQRYASRKWLARVSKRAERAGSEAAKAVRETERLAAKLEALEQRLAAIEVDQQELCDLRLMEQPIPPTEMHTATGHQLDAACEREGFRERRAGEADPMYRAAALNWYRRCMGAGSDAWEECCPRWAKSDPEGDALADAEAAKSPRPDDPVDT